MGFGKKGAADFQQKFQQNVPWRERSENESENPTNVAQQCCQSFNAV
jgi:hypothetical protein